MWSLWSLVVVAVVVVVGSDAGVVGRRDHQQQLDMQMSVIFTRIAKNQSLTLLALQNKFASLESLIVKKRYGNDKWRKNLKNLMPDDSVAYMRVSFEMVAKELTNSTPISSDHISQMKNNFLLDSFACQSSFLAAFWIHYGADPNHADPSGQAPLELAARLGWNPIVELLLQSGSSYQLSADLLSKLACADYTNRELLDLLLRTGVDKDSADSKGRTGLHYAVECSNEIYVRALVSAGANVRLRDDQGFTALHLAVADAVIVAKLIDAGAQVGARASDGSTPLHVAVVANQPESARALIRAGAACWLRNWNGESPFDLALRMYPHEEIASIVGLGLNTKNV